VRDACTLDAVTDDELISLAKEHIGAAFGLSEAQSVRLRGSTRAEIEGDAKQMRDELGLEPLGGHDDRGRDQQGRFASGTTMNERIRAASGR
jgi:hypothetical protein